LNDRRRQGPGCGSPYDLSRRPNVRIDGEKNGRRKRKRQNAGLVSKGKSLIVRFGPKIGQITHDGGQCGAQIDLPTLKRSPLELEVLISRPGWRRKLMVGRRRLNMVVLSLDPFFEI
jgi:hypothetical protein